MSQEAPKYMSVSWSPDESPPSRDEMRAAAEKIIADLAGCRAGPLVVARDAHPHCHFHFIIKPERPSQTARR